MAPDSEVLESPSHSAVGRQVTGMLLGSWILLSALFFYIRFSYVFFLTYEDVIAALFRQFFGG